MGELLTLEQDPVRQIGQLSWITERDIWKEPTMRSTRPDIAYEQGGPITRGFLDIAANAGFVAANSTVMLRRTPFVSGAFSTQPHWHGDLTQGRKPDRLGFKDAILDNTGLLGVFFETAEHPSDQGTIFIEGGAITLDLGQRDEEREYKGRKNFTRSGSGVLEWQHDQVEEQLADPNTSLTTTPIKPNTINAYGSHNIHKVPRMLSDHGARIVVRLNTPVNQVMPDIKNQVYPPNQEPMYVVRMLDELRWVRQSVAA